MNLYCIESPDLNPYHNIALEEYLTDTVSDGEVILYIWRNRRTVVVGRNQNIFNECRCSLLKADGGFPARRLSGGGAVYHDEGNVNFSFIARNKLYTVEKQTAVILAAVQSLGLHAENSGRNDLTINGRKFSGNAFFSKKQASCHHGTLLLKTDTALLKKYLSVSKKKFEGKAVSSVQSRVCNLSDFDCLITPAKMTAALITAFGRLYGGDVQPYPAGRLCLPELEKAEKRFGSDAWIYGMNRVFTDSFERKFAWGLVSVCINVRSGIIADCVIHTDSLETELFPLAASKLSGRKFSSDETMQVFSELNRIVAGPQNKKTILCDIRDMIIHEQKISAL
ncbi:MAG: lipoate--protein ligase [Treponema sp.]|jgi:lipoate-protein ligase A|nr:lipoate--protein ligase [Treponema sp.]